MDTKNTMILSGKEIFKQAWAIYKQRWTFFVQLMILPFILSVFFLFFVNEKLSSTATNLNIAYFIVYFIVYSAIFSWSQIVLILWLRDSMDKQEEVNVQALFKNALPKILGCWWVGFLVSAAVVVGFILLIVPGVIFATWFVFAPTILICEGLKGTMALKKSKEYVKGRWSTVFSSVFYLGVVTFIISLVVSILAGFFGSAGPVARQITSSLVITPISTIYIYLLYKNLKATKTEDGVEAVPVPAQ